MRLPSMLVVFAAVVLLFFAGGCGSTPTNTNTTPTTEHPGYPEQWFIKITTGDSEMQPYRITDPNMPLRLPLQLDAAGEFWTGMSIGPADFEFILATKKGQLQPGDCSEGRALGAYFGLGGHELYPLSIGRQMSDGLCIYVIKSPFRFVKITRYSSY